MILFFFLFCCNFLLNYFFSRIISIWFSKPNEFTIFFIKYDILCAFSFYCFSRCLLFFLFLYYSFLIWWFCFTLSIQYFFSYQESCCSATANLDGSGNFSSLGILASSSCNSVTAPFIANALCDGRNSCNLMCQKRKIMIFRYLMY